MRIVMECAHIYSNSSKNVLIFRSKMPFLGVYGEKKKYPHPAGIKMRARVNAGFRNAGTGTGIWPKKARAPASRGYPYPRVLNSN